MSTDTPTGRDVDPAAPRFTLEDLRRVMDLPALINFVADQRGAAEFDRRAAGGLAMPPELTSPRDKARFLEHLQADVGYDGHAYALAEITDEEVTLYLLSPAQPTPPDWLHRLTGPPPKERTKPWEPTAPRYGATPPPRRPQVEGPPVLLWPRDHPDNPWRAERPEQVRPNQAPEQLEPESPHPVDAPTPEPTGLRRLVRRVTGGDQP